MRPTRFIVCLLCLLALLPVQAAERKDAEALYQQGIQLIREQKFDDAITVLENAHQAGYEQPSLHYNRGVALYRLQRYGEAKAAFSKAGQGALVLYNLGLVNYRLNENDQAREYFERVQQLQPGSQLAEMADKALQRLDAKPAKVKTVKAWSLIADAMLGFDDNVTLENTELAADSNKEDLYLDLYLSGKYRLTGDKRNGLSLGAGLSAIHYRTEGDYDYTQYHLSLTQDNRFSGWRTRVMGKVARIDLGGEEYLQKGSARLQLSYDLSRAQRILGYYDLTHYDELDSRYAYLSGLRHKVKLESRWRLNKTRLRLGYDYEYNDRDDFSGGDDFISYSATRHTLLGEVGFPVAINLKGKLRAEYRTSLYNDANIINGVEQSTREDDRYRLTAKLTYRINREWDFVTSYIYTDNDSNDPDKTYQRNQVLVGVQSLF